MSTRWTWHGGGLRAAQARFGGAEWLDLSTGINPHGWPVPPLDIDWARLPDEHDLAALEAAAAAHFGAAAGHVCAVPGSEIGLRLVGGVLAGQACHLVPGYRTHAEMLAGSRAVATPGEADGATLILANPGNPDGHVFGRDHLLDLLARRGDGWLLVDEAFADCDPAISLADAVAADRRLIVFRSFGKFFGLAGVRLGFVIGPPALLDEVRRTLGAWPVAAAAIAIGTAAYRDRGWIDAMRTRLRVEAASLDALLCDAGFRPRGACPLFRLIETGDAAALFDRLARASILTRPFAGDTHRLRIGLPPDADAAARLAAALGRG